MHGWQHNTARGTWVGCRKWTTDRPYAWVTTRLESHTHGLPTMNERVERKEDRQVFFMRYRNTALVEHLGNILGSIRIQKHHLIETKRPRTPLKLPHLRYRTRDLRLRIILKFDFKLAKDPYKRKSGGIYNPPTLHNTRPNQPTWRKIQAEIKLN